MKGPNGGWSNASQAKPASELTIRYGHDLLRRESEQWPRYLVVTMPDAYEAAQSYLAKAPTGIGHVRWLDWTHLEETANSLPDETELVIGLGGGTALDASKYVALTKKRPLILVPTIVSTGAIIHGTCARWEGRKLMGTRDDWPWIDAKEVLVDYDVVLEAPEHLNTAGLGDVLCGYAGLAEWRRNARLGVGPPFDEDTVATSAGHHQQIVSGFPETLTSEGHLTAESVRFIMTAVQERDVKALRHPAAPSGDHSLSVCLEEVNNKGWIHGETVAMSAVIIAWHCDESPETLVGRLDTCKVRWRPREIGMNRQELQKGLQEAPRFMSDKAHGLASDSILRREPIVGARFDALWEYLDRV